MDEYKRLSSSDMREKHTKKFTQKFILLYHENFNNHTIFCEQNVLHGNILDFFQC